MEKNGGQTPLFAKHIDRNISPEKLEEKTPPKAEHF